MTTIDLTAFETTLGNIEGFVSEKAVKIAARVVKERIIGLSLQGLDADGIPFPKISTRKGLRTYTPAYERYKAKRGGRTDIRNLWLSGTMLPSMYLEGNELKFPSDQEGKAEGNMSIKTNDPRAINFFAVSEETAQLAADEIDRELQAEIDGWEFSHQEIIF